MRSLPSLLVVSMLFSSLAFAEIKLGYVDLQRALGEVTEGKSAKERLKRDLDKKKAELDSEQEKLRADKAVLDKQSAMMAEETRNQKFTELQKRLFELTQKAEKMQAEMAQAEQIELKKIFTKMDPIIARIAEREGLTMVFEKTDSGLVYAPASLDLTNELVRTYNADNPNKGVALKDTKKDAAKDAAPAPKK